MVKQLNKDVRKINPLLVYVISTLKTLNMLFWIAQDRLQINSSST